MILCLYIDVTLMVEDRTTIKETAAQLRTKVSLKEVRDLTEYWNNHYQRSQVL
jgi:hypothetical protein